LKQFTNCDSSGKPKNANLKIGFAQTDLSTPWRVTEMSTFQTWAKKLCVPNFVSNQANENVSTELNNAQTLLAQQPSVLILDPLATDPLTPVVTQATSANIPLIVIDRALSVKPGQGTYQLFLGAQQYPIGNLPALKWIEKLKTVQKTDSPKANLVFLDGGVGQEPAIERHQGVLDAIKPYPNIHVVGAESGNWTLEGGRQVMEAYIQRYPPGTLQGVYAASDEMMLGALEALQAAHRTDLDGWFFSGDGQLQGLQQIAAGVNVADTQNPPFYGESALEAAIAISQGVQFHAQSFNLENKTFDCLTDAECQVTKTYIAKIEQEKSLF
jgi:ABC-type sugar transport system substrate-binding protein